MMEQQEALRPRNLDKLMGKSNSKPIQSFNFNEKKVNVFRINQPSNYIFIEFTLQCNSISIKISVPVNLHLIFEDPWSVGVRHALGLGNTPDMLNVHSETSVHVC